MEKEMEKQETTEKKQAPRHIGRKLAAAITAATELVVPATQVLADGVPTPDPKQPTSVTGPAVPGKETTKTKEVKYVVAYDTKDLLKDAPYISENEDGSFQLATSGEDYPLPSFQIKGDFAIRFQISGTSGYYLKFCNTDFRTAPYETWFKRKANGATLSLWTFADNPVLRGQLSLVFYEPAYDAGLTDRVQEVPDFFGKEGLPIPEKDNDLVISFENITKKQPETVTLLDPKTNKILFKTQLPDCLFSTGEVHPYIRPPWTDKTPIWNITHFQILTPQNASGNVKRIEP